MFRLFTPGATRQRRIRIVDSCVQVFSDPGATPGASTIYPYWNQWFTAPFPGPRASSAHPSHGSFAYRLRLPAPPSSPSTKPRDSVPPSRRLQYSSTVARWASVTVNGGSTRLELATSGVTGTPVARQRSLLSRIAALRMNSTRKAPRGSCIRSEGRLTFQGRRLGHRLGSVRLSGCCSRRRIRSDRP